MAERERDPMNDIPFVPAILIAATGCVVTFLAGYSTGRNHSRARMRELKRDLVALNYKIDNLTEMALVDPMRAGITSGANYILRELEELLQRLRKDMQE